MRKAFEELAGYVRERFDPAKGWKVEETGQSESPSFELYHAGLRVWRGMKSGLWLEVGVDDWPVFYGLHLRVETESQLGRLATGICWALALLTMVAGPIVSGFAGWDIGYWWLPLDLILVLVVAMGLELLPDVISAWLGWNQVRLEDLRAVRDHAIPIWQRLAEEIGLDEPLDPEGSGALERFEREQALLKEGK